MDNRLLKIQCLRKKCEEESRAFPRGSAVKNSSAMQETWVATQKTWVRSLCQKIPWRRAWQPSSVFLRFHGPRSLMDLHSLWGHRKLDMTLSYWARTVFLFVVTARRLSFPEGVIIRNFLFNLLEMIFTLLVVYLHSLFFLQMATYYTVLDLAFFT